MFKVALFIFTLISLRPYCSEDINYSVRALYQLGHQLELFKEVYPTCSESKIQEHVKNASECLYTVCPDIKSDGYFNENLDSKLVNLKVANQEDFSRELKKAIDSSQKIKELYKTRWSKWKKQGVPNLSDKEKKLFIAETLFNFAFESSRESEIEAILASDEDNMLSFAFVLTNGKFDQLTNILENSFGKSVSDFTSLLNSMFNKKAMREFLNFTVYGAKEYFKRFKPGLSVKRVLKSKLDTLVALRDSQELVNGSSGLISESLVFSLSEMIRKIELGYLPSEESLYYMFLSVARVEILSESLFDNSFQEQLNSLDYNKVWKLFKGEHYFFGDGVKDNIDWYTNNCINNFRLTSFSPSEDEIKQAKNLAKKSKEKLVGWIGSNYSETSSAFLEEAVRDAYFLYPDSSLTMQTDLIESMKSLNLKNKQLLSKMVGKEGDKLSLFRMFDSVEDGMLEEIRRICSSIGLSPSVIDNNTTYSGKIEVSWQSCKHHEFGENTILHELGHSLDRAIEKNQTRLSKETENIQKNVRSCISLNHSFEEAPGRFFGEDFADMLAHELSSSSVGADCLMLRSDEAKLVEDFYAIKADEKDSIHSSTFYRVLSEYKVKKGKFPNSCLKYLSVEAPLAEFRNCSPSKNK